MFDSNSTTCSACFQEFNLSDRLPRSISNCGHIICSQCINEILRFPIQIRCPIDKKPLFLQKPSLSCFPINTQIQNILTKNTSLGLCQVHRKELEYICLNDHTKLCNSCVLFGDLGEHRTHNIQLLKECYPQINAQVECLQRGLQNLDNYYQEASYVLLERKVSMLRIISSGFEELTRMIRLRERHLMGELETFFDNQLKGLNQAYGNHSELRRNIIEKITKCESYMRSAHPFSLFEEDLEQLMKKCEYGILKGKLEKTNNSLKEIFGSLDKALVTQIDSFNKIGEPGRIFNMELKDLASIDDSVGFQSINNGQNNMMFNNREGALEIEMDPETALLLQRMSYMT